MKRNKTNYPDETDAFFEDIPPLEDSETELFRNAGEQSDDAYVDGAAAIYNEMTKTPALSRDQEHFYAIKYRTGTAEEKKQAEDKLVLSNMRFVMKIALSFHPKEEDRDDYIQEGYRGLKHAISKFDPDKKFRLNTYAGQWITVYIQRLIDNTSRSIRIPVHIRQGILKLRKAMDELEIEGPDLNENQVKALAQKTGFSIKKVREYALYLSDSLSLDAIVGDEENGATIGDFITSTSQDADPVATLEDKERKRAIDELLNSVLTEKEADVLRLRHGFGKDSKPCTLEEIGKMYGVTRERIRQIEASALQKLRDNAELFGLRDFL